MYEDSKLTYIVIAVLVLVLGISAVFLRDGYVIKDFTLDTSATNISTATPSIIKKIITRTSKTNTEDNVTSSASSTIIIATTTNSNMNTPQDIKSALIKTNMGDIEFEFATNTPNTVANFVSLASNGFYNGIRFHRVIKDFMIQGGDPLSKDILQKNIWGQGGPGYKFNDELTGDEKYTTGTVAMANAGPNTNGSQFFIVTAKPDVALPPSYTVFGHVTSGIEIAMKIQDIQTDASDRPLKDVIIESVELK